MTQIGLFGTPVRCACCRRYAVGYVTDEYGEAWLCPNHLKSYEVEWRSIGRTVPGFLEAH